MKVIDTELVLDENCCLNKYFPVLETIIRVLVSSALHNAKVEVQFSIEVVEKKVILVRTPGSERLEISHQSLDKSK